MYAQISWKLGQGLNFAHLSLKKQLFRVFFKEAPQFCAKQKCIAVDLDTVFCRD